MRSIDVAANTRPSRGTGRPGGRRRRIGPIAVLVILAVAAAALFVLGRGPSGILGSIALEEIDPAPPGTPAVFLHYGNPQVPISLADTEAGGPSVAAVSHRIRFPRSGVLEAVRPFLIYVVGEEGDDAFYHKGDGGTLELRLETDDGTPAHHPTGEVLARTGNLIGAPELYAGSGAADAVIGGDPDDDGNFRRFEFIEPVEVKADTWYHLVMYNTGRAAADNFVSFDDFTSGDRSRSVGAPLFGELDFGVQFLADGVWTEREAAWAIGDFYFADGSGYGNGYMEVGSVNGPDRAANFVDRQQSIRQTFRPTRDLLVSEIHLAAMHIDGPNQLSVAIEGDGGDELWSGAVDGFPAGQVSGDPLGNTTVATAEFRGDTATASIELRAGIEYSLVVTSIGGTHTVTATRDGSGFGFGPDSTIDGHAQRRTGTGDWEGWDLRDTGPSELFDLSFFLVTENCADCG